MRPTIVFGDIHGLTLWKTAVNENPNYRYIFLGDYLDPYGNIPCSKLLDNLKDIIQLKKERNDDVVLLLGNHDLHYVDLDSEPCERFDDDIAGDANALFSENNHLFTYAFQEDDRIFTHAGISQRWFSNDFCGNADKNIAEQLNNPHKDQLQALFRCGAMRGGELSDIGGIFWIDIDELYDPLPGYTQIVGHTRVDVILERTLNGGHIIFCDCLYNKRYLRLD
jgi:hypothetical protein